jgi:hypothetical protein
LTEILTEKGVLLRSKLIKKICETFLGNRYFGFYVLFILWAHVFAAEAFLLQGQVNSFETENSHA